MREFRVCLFGIDFSDNWAADPALNRLVWADFQANWPEPELVELAYIDEVVVKARNEVDAVRLAWWASAIGRVWVHLFETSPEMPACLRNMVEGRRRPSRTNSEAIGGFAESDFPGFDYRLGWDVHCTIREV